MEDVISRGGRSTSRMQSRLVVFLEGWAGDKMSGYWEGMSGKGGRVAYGRGAVFRL